MQNLKGGEGYFHSVVVNLASGLLQTGQLREAEEFIDQALSMLPKDSDLMLLKGMAALNNKEYEAAIEFLIQAVAGKKEKALVGSIHTLCGDLYAVLDDYDHAESEYYSSLQCVPQHMYPLMQIIGLKQRGKTQLTWHKLSQFTSQQINRNLQYQLTKMEELPLVLVLALLNIINRNSNDKVDIRIACNDYLQAVMRYRPTDELSKIVIEYLTYSAEMLLLYVGMMSFNCDNTFLPMMQDIEKITNENLDLMIRTLCPTWIPCITLHKILPNTEE